MNASLTALIVFGCLVGAVFIGRTLRGVLPEKHLSTESKDAMKLAIGLVATMSALVLGLLVSSTKGAYDTERSEVILMASKVTFLGRVLDAYGPDAAGVRTLVRNRPRSQFNKCGPAKCAARQIAIPTFKQVILPTPRYSSFHRRTTCRESSNPGQRRWPRISLRLDHC